MSVTVESPATRVVVSAGDSSIVVGSPATSVTVGTSIASGGGGEVNALEDASSGGVSLVASPPKIGLLLQLRGVGAGSSGLVTVTEDAPNELAVIDIDTDQLMADLRPQLKTLIDEAAGDITYVGEAAPGTAESAAAWRIFRLDESEGDLANVELVKKFAEGSTGFDQVWDDRTTLSYS
jgi:hypothetical protein